MRLAIGTLLMASLLPYSTRAQSNDTNSGGKGAPAAAPVAVPERSLDGYTVFNATAEQEAALRTEIRAMHPDVLPLRVFFVPHWKYLASARDFHLHVPTGYSSIMFTHLPSRTVFIDNDRYAGEDWLGHWIAHELGHLTTNSTKEGDAEKAAREFRKRLQDGSKGSAFMQLRWAPEAKWQGS